MLRRCVYDSSLGAMPHLNLCALARMYICTNKNLSWGISLYQATKHGPSYTEIEVYRVHLK